MTDMPDKIHEAYGMECTEIEEFSTGYSGKTYEILSNGESWVVKLIPAEDKVRVNETLNFLRHISDSGISVPNPVVTKSGELFDMLVHDATGHIMYVYRKLTGENAEDRIDDHIHQNKMRDLGCEVALLHQAMQSFDREKLAGTTRWNETDCLFMVSGEVNPGIDADILRDLENAKIPVMMFSNCNRGGYAYEDIDFGSKWCIARNGRDDFSFGSASPMAFSPSSHGGCDRDYIGWQTSYC
jgi:Ser/Thr protein kinase RdoA (MazF antagonist)